MVEVPEDKERASEETSSLLLKGEVWKVHKNQLIHAIWKDPRGKKSADHQQTPKRVWKCKLLRAGCEHHLSIENHANVSDSSTVDADEFFRWTGSNRYNLQNLAKLFAFCLTQLPPQQATLLALGGNEVI